MSLPGDLGFPGVCPQSEKRLVVGAVKAKTPEKERIELYLRLQIKRESNRI